MKNIIITGSSSGFGLKAAKDFADKGNKVFATMRNPEGKNAVAKAELESHSAHIKVLDMDVTSEASVKEGIAGILAEVGSIDILINNAGIMFLGITEAFSVEQAHFQMETNYYGAIRVMQAVLPSMRKAGSGLIINTFLHHKGFGSCDFFMLPLLRKGWQQAILKVSQSAKNQKRRLAPNSWHPFGTQWTFTGNLPTGSILHAKLVVPVIRMIGFWQLALTRGNTPLVFLTARLPFDSPCFFEGLFVLETPFIRLLPYFSSVCLNASHTLLPHSWVPYSENDIL